MNHATTCKFCRIPITVTINDEYAKLGDPYKLLPLASCNRCADLRQQRRSLEDRFRRASRIVSLCGSDSDQRQTMKGVLQRLCVAYADLVIRWKRVSPMDQDTIKAMADDAVNGILDKPDALNVVLNTFWQLIKQEELAL